MTQLFTAAEHLTENLKKLREHNPELRFLNLDEMEAALNLHRPVDRREASIRYKEMADEARKEMSKLPPLKTIDTVLLPGPTRMEA